MRNSASSRLNCRCNQSDGLAGASVVPNDFSGHIVGGVQIRTGQIHAAPFIAARSALYHARKQVRTAAQGFLSRWDARQVGALDGG
jgi:hypothetical protein